MPVIPEGLYRQVTIITDGRDDERNYKLPSTKKQWEYYASN